MQQHGSKYFAHRQIPHPCGSGGLKGHNSFFSEHSHLAYRIKWNHECINMVGDSLPADPPPHDPRGWGQKVKIQLFQNMIMLHIKLNGITNAEA